MKLRLRRSVLGNAQFGLAVGLALVSGFGCSDDDSIPEVPMFDGGGSSDTTSPIDTDTTNGGGGTTDPTDTDTESSDTSDPTDTIDVNPTGTDESSSTTPITDPTETTGDTSSLIVTSDPTSETMAPTSAPTSDPGATSDPGSSSEEFPNLIANGGFESGSTGWNTWNGTTLTVSTAKARSGQQSLMGSGGTGTGPIATTISPIVPGGTYEVTFWASVGTGTASVRLVRGLACADNQYLWVVGNTNVSSTGWTELTGQFTVPDDCDSTSFQVYLEGDAAGVDLYVDDVSVTLLPPDDTSGTDTSGMDTSGTGTMDPGTTGMDMDSGVVDTGETTEDPDASVDTGETMMDPDAGDASTTDPVDTTDEVMTESDASVSTDEVVTTDVMTSEAVDTSTMDEATSDSEPTNLVSNGTFETGTAGWSSWESTLAISTDQARTGLQSLYVSGLDANLAATEVSVEAGMTYNISLWARLEFDGLANIHVVVNLPGCINYEWVIGNTAVGDEVWTELSGSFAVPGDCVATTAQVYSEAAATEVNFYIDDVLITEGVN